MDYTGPMTALRAVNTILKGMGEAPINSLSEAGIDAQTALDTLQETSFKVQAKGWHWNRETHTLSPDANGNINLPANTAKVDTVDGDKPVDVVQRGQRLFNRKGATYSFTKPLCVELVVILQFDDLPNPAKIFVSAAAAMAMQQQIVGSDEVDKMLRATATDAWQELIRDDMEVGDYNILTDSWSTVGILDRSSGFYRGGGR